MVRSDVLARCRKMQSTDKNRLAMKRRRILAKKNKGKPSTKNKRAKSQPKVVDVVRSFCVSHVPVCWMCVLWWVVGICGRLYVEGILGLAQSHRCRRVAAGDQGTASLHVFKRHDLRPGRVFQACCAWTDHQGSGRGGAGHGRISGGGPDGARTFVQLAFLLKTHSFTTLGTHTHTHTRSLAGSRWRRL
jgi:hypothetical protein